MRRALVAVLTFVAVGFGVAGAAAGGASASVDEPDPPRITVNEFMPEERSLSDCLSVLPKPGCGSEARGGPYQAAVFGAMVVGLGVIGTRIVVGIRRRDRTPIGSDATTSTSASTDANPGATTDRTPGPSPSE